MSFSLEPGATITLNESMYEVIGNPHWPKFAFAQEGRRSVVYKLKERVAINALPDVNELVKELSFLIENPQEIISIGKNARAFVEKEHDYVKIAEKYLNKWNS